MGGSGGDPPLLGLPGASKGVPEGGWAGDMACTFGGWGIGGLFDREDGPALGGEGTTLPGSGTGSGVGTGSSAMFLQLVCPANAQELHQQGTVLEFLFHHGYQPPAVMVGQMLQHFFSGFPRIFLRVPEFAQVTEEVTVGGRCQKHRLK